MRAVFDPDLEVVIRGRRELRYGLGADPSIDRPAHVRAASAVVRMGTRLAIVQDDASFLALVDGERDGGEVHALPLPHHEGGLRQFDDLRGNKKHKLDLEACTLVGDSLIAFGSGSSPARERLAIMRKNELRIFDASSLYASLRAQVDFSGSELNVEGATCVGAHVRLFQRGNGAPRGELSPVDATVDIPADALLAFVDGGPTPLLSNVTRWDLGSIDGVRLGFTDATTHDGRVFFLAAAEDSPDAVRDGPCLGVALGVIEPGGARMARIRDFDLKAEGLAFHSANEGVLVVDRDEPEAPAELCRFELLGRWHG
ncbi:MAG: DUF6929 family protein [Polyangiales bacterium]